MFVQSIGAESCSVRKTGKGQILGGGGGISEKEER